MGQPAAKQNDQIMGLCTHTVVIPGASPAPLPHMFAGILDDKLSSDVNIMGMAAATKESKATNTPSHIPTPPGTAFQTPPDNKAEIISGSSTVNINGKPAARMGDKAKTCDEIAVPANVVAGGTVFIGG